MLGRGQTGWRQAGWRDSEAAVPWVESRRESPALVTSRWSGFSLEEMLPFVVTASVHSANSPQTLGAEAEWSLPKTEPCGTSARLVATCPH